MRLCSSARALLAMIVGVPLLVGSPTAAAQSELSTTAEIPTSTRCRADASPDADVIEVVPEGAQLEVTGEPVGEWQPVACGNGEGFVHRDLVSIRPVIAPDAGKRADLGTPDRGIILGVEWTDEGNVPRELDALAGEIGRMPPIVMWYQAWGDTEHWSGVQTEILETVASRGATPLITWEPWVPAEGAAQPTYQLDRIVEGDFDAYIDTWATELAAFGRPVYLRFAHEMNGDWYPWSPGVNGNTVEDYGAAWRHVHDRFAAAGADNVRWVWGPNADWYDGQTPMEALYPGDEYVDWVGLSGFNWGTSAFWEECSCSSQWQSFEEIFATSYATLTELTDKPIMIAEMNSAEEGGDKAAWIAELQTLLEEDFPRLRAVVWFDEDRRPIRSSAEAFQAFVELARHPYFQGTPS